MIYNLEVIEEVKEEYLTAVKYPLVNEEGREPSLSLVSVTDGTARNTGQFFAASLCQGGPGPSFFAHGYIIIWLMELKQHCYITKT